MHVEQAVERYGPLVMSLIWRINGNQEETADLYQEVFVKFHETTSERGLSLGASPRRNLTTGRRTMCSIMA